MNETGTVNKIDGKHGKKNYVKSSDIKRDSYSRIKDRYSHYSGIAVYFVNAEGVK